MDNKVEAYKESTLCLRQSKRLKRKKDKLIHLSNENIRPQPETQNQSFPQRNHNTVSKEKHTAEIINRLNLMKIKKAEEVADRLFKSKEAQATDMIKIAQKKELEANSKLQEARAKEASVHLYEIEVDEKKVMLNDLAYRISELQDVLDEYKHQIRGQKELVWYYKKK